MSGDGHIPGQKDDVLSAAVSDENRQCGVVTAATGRVLTISGYSPISVKITLSGRGTFRCPTSQFFGSSTPQGFGLASVVVIVDARSAGIRTTPPSRSTGR